MCTDDLQESQATHSAVSAAVAFCMDVSWGRKTERRGQRSYSSCVHSQGEDYAEEDDDDEDDEEEDETAAPKRKLAYGVGADYSVVVVVLASGSMLQESPACLTRAWARCTLPARCFGLCVFYVHTGMRWVKHLTG